MTIRDMPEPKETTVKVTLAVSIAWVDPFEHLTITSRLYWWIVRKNYHIQIVKIIE